MFYNVYYITGNYSNIPIDLHKAVENSKKLILAIAKEQIDTHSNYLTNNTLMYYKPLAHKATGIQDYTIIFFKVSNSGIQSSSRYLYKDLLTTHLTRCALI